MESHQIDTIPYDSLVKVEFSGAFTQRIQNALFALLSEKEDKPEELARILKELETRKPKSDWEEHVYILLSILYEIDNQAAQQKLIVKQTIDIPPSDSPQEASPES